MSFVVLLISFGYCLILLGLAMPALRYMPSSLSRKRTQHHHRFSIIVVYRNEVRALPQLLESIRQMDYPKDACEWWFVNDESTDGSKSLVQDFAAGNPSIQIHLLERPKRSASAKKDGITAAVSQSSYDHIITTDADCLLPKTWLLSFNNHYQQFADAMLVAAPIQLSGKGFIAAIQQLEMMALQAITAGSFAMRQPFMCNGANLSFSKNAFNLVDGYLGNDQFSSGDDVFLLEKLAAEDVLQCHYLKSEEAIVTTPAKSSFNALIEQRARWSRKGKHTKSLLNKLVSAHVFLMNLLFLGVPVLLLLDLMDFKLGVMVILIKFFTDAVVLLVGNQVTPFLWARYFLIQFFVYPFVVIAVAARSLGTIEWHGRSIDQE
ncbi:glycosyltransferase [Nonlabens agnitus]|uniref:Glycosyltransferase 2-like domain-containing protein n=1 Tax=Nonlabens agnitus TaxID=870484 RepID=A0A2S9WX81_9FLAO|nr:glycosyltransferase [Nonlabens agnitus]PRP68073.1 hypothetical protein BST86_13725 [Nonlabens agnitus]